MAKGLKIHVSPVQSRPYPLPLIQPNEQGKPGEKPGSPSPFPNAQNCSELPNHALTETPGHYGSHCGGGGKSDVFGEFPFAKPDRSGILAVRTTVNASGFTCQIYDHDGSFIAGYDDRHMRWWGRYQMTSDAVAKAAGIPVEWLKGLLDGLFLAHLQQESVQDQAKKQDDRHMRRHYNARLKRQAAAVSVARRSAERVASRHVAVSRHVPSDVPGSIAGIAELYRYDNYGPCIYFLCKNKQVVYVGQSINLPSRLTQHRDKDFDEAFYFPCEEQCLDSVERHYITSLDPIYNETHSPRLNKKPPVQSASPASLASFLDAALPDGGAS